jgi:hypothetical protein
MISKILLIITFATTISTILVSSPIINTFAQNDDASNPMTSDTNDNNMSMTNENMDTTSDNLTGANEQPGSEGTFGKIKDTLGGILGNGGNDQSTTGENSEQNSEGTFGKIKDKLGGILGN